MFLKDELYYQQSIKRISDILNSFRDLNSLFKVILDEVDRIVPSTSSNIALIEGSVLKNMAVRGYEKYGVEDFVKNFEVYK